VLKATIRELWRAHPETKALGTIKLRMLLRVHHTDWQIAEKRLRRIRQELFNEEAVNVEEDDLSDMPPEFKGFNKHKTYDLSRGQVATVFTVPGDSGPQQMIEEDGQEYQVLLQYGIKVATGRQFKKDGVTGKWVLDV
jgi:hypothetical protein